MASLSILIDLGCLGSSQAFYWCYHLMHQYITWCVVWSLSSVVHSLCIPPGGLCTFCCGWLDFPVREVHCDASGSNWMGKIGSKSAAGPNYSHSPSLLQCRNWSGVVHFKFLIFLIFWSENPLLKIEFQILNCSHLPTGLQWSEMQCRSWASELHGKVRPLAQDLPYLVMDPSGLIWAGVSSLEEWIAVGCSPKFSCGLFLMGSWCDFPTHEVPVLK